MSTENSELWRLQRVPLSAYKTANETVNNSNTLQNDDALFLYLPTGRYRIRLANARFTSSTTADFRWTFTFSGTGTCHFACYVRNLASTNVTARSIPTFATMVNFGATTGVEHVLTCDGGVDITVPGLLNFQWAQNGAEVSDTIVYANATIEAFPAP